MSNPPSQDPSSLLILGATGGTGLSLLKKALSYNTTTDRTPIQITVLVRTPSKLLSLLAPPPTTSSPKPELTTYKAPPNLRIIQGSIRDLAVLKQCLINPDGTPVSAIISTVGMLPAAKHTGPNGTRTWGDVLRAVRDPFIGTPDTTICEAGMENLIKGLEEVKAERAAAAVSGSAASAGVGNGEADAQPVDPYIIALSTTGVTPLGRDFPFLLKWLYSWYLHTAHVDKYHMERLLSSQTSFPRWTIVRASLLLDGAAKGAEKVRTMVEKGGKMVTGYKIGYVIRREDVGGWIWSRLLVCGGEGEGVGGASGEVLSGGEREWVKRREGFEGAAVGITY